MGEEYDRPKSRLSFVNKNADLKTGLEKLSLFQEGDSTKLGLFNSGAASTNQDEGACGLYDEKVTLAIRTRPTFIVRSHLRFVDGRGL